MDGGQAPLKEQVDFNSHLFDAAVIKDWIVKLAEDYGMPYCCVALDCGDRLVLRAKHGRLPSVVDATPQGSARLARISARRKLPKIIYDASEDDRYIQDPLVTGATQVRLFIGAPILLSSEQCLGMICLMSPEKADFYSLNDCEMLLGAAEAIAAQYSKLNTQHERAQATITTIHELAPMEPACSVRNRWAQIASGPPASDEPTTPRE